MLQMLAKMIRPEEFLGLVTLSKFMHVIQVLGSDIPVGRIWELLTAITAHIGCRRVVLRGVECRMYPRKRSARPRVTTEMKGILVSFGLIFILESVSAVLTSVLLL